MTPINSFNRAIVRPLIFMLTGLMLLSSCSDFLDVEPSDIIIGRKYWKEKSDVDNVVAGCYSGLQKQECIERMMIWGEFRSENIMAGTNAADNASLSNILKENINSSNAYTTWNSFYKVINDCNMVVEKAPDVAKLDPSFSQSEMKATIAEVSAIRDLCYFYLIRSFRDVPYTTTAFESDDQQLALPATPFNQVLDSLIDDLESVQNNAVITYPKSKLYYQVGRVTQNAIHAMLCEMYLWKGDYAASVRYADLVIDAMTRAYQEELNSKTYSSSDDEMIDGYPLIRNNMGNTYGVAYEDIFGMGNSRESIFELIYMESESALHNTAVSTFYGNSTTYPGLVQPSTFLSGDITLDKPKVFRSKYDARYYESIEKSSSNSYGIAKYATNSITIQPVGTNVEATYGSHYSSSFCTANWILYRLTDVMLMKAEALVCMAPDDDNDTTANKHLRDSLLRAAYSIVNTINRRSDCNTIHTDIDYTTYASKTQMLNLVYDERERELMFEGKRWYDLVRRSLRDGNTKYLISKVTQKGSDNASVLQSKLAKMDALFWPYNKEELKVNPYLKQNPAYNDLDNGSSTLTK